VMSVSVLCLSVYQEPNFLSLLPVAVGSVLLRRRCDVLSTSGFVDGVMFAQNGDE